MVQQLLRAGEHIVGGRSCLCDLVQPWHERDHRQVGHQRGRANGDQHRRQIHRLRVDAHVSRALLHGGRQQVFCGGGHRCRCHQQRHARLVLLFGPRGQFDRQIRGGLGPWCRQRHAHHGIVRPQRQPGLGHDHRQHHAVRQQHHGADERRQRQYRDRHGGQHQWPHQFCRQQIAVISPL